MRLLKNKKAALLQNLGGGRLPNEYQEVKWIESTTDNELNAGQFIDTRIGVLGKTTTLKWVQDFSFLTTRSTLIGTYFYNQYFCFNQTSTNLQIMSGQNVYNVGVADQFRHKMTIDLYNQVASCDDMEVSITRPTTLYYNLKLFRYNNQLQNGTSAKLRLYSSQIYESDVLVRDFVPCYRKADNEIGLYDLVNEEFYSNNGTGNFVKGPQV